MNTRSSTETPPDWTDLNSNTKAGLFQILKELKIAPPQNADRDQLVRLIRQKLTSPRLSPYKSTGMLTRPADNLIPNSDDDDIPAQESVEPEDDENDTDFEVPPMESESVSQNTIQEEPEGKVEEPKQPERVPTPPKSEEKKIEEPVEPEHRIYSPTRTIKTPERSVLFPSSQPLPSPKEQVRPSSIRQSNARVRNDGNPEEVDDAIFTNSYLRWVRRPVIILAGFILLLLALLLLLIALRPSRRSVLHANIDWLSNVSYRNKHCLQETQYTRAELFNLYNLIEEEFNQYAYEDGERVFAKDTRIGVVCKMIYAGDKYPVAAGIIIVIIVVAIHLYICKISRVGNHLIRSLVRDQSCDLDTLLVDEAGEMLPHEVAERLGINASDDYYIDPRDTIYELTRARKAKKNKK